jgi:hypothetical protein
MGEVNMLRGSHLVLATSVLCGCGSGGGPASPSGSAALTLDVAPNPLVEAICPVSACGPASGQLYAVGTLTVRETSGVGGRVDSIAMTQRTADGTIQGSGQFDANAITALAVTNRFAGNASLSIPGIGVHYARALGGRPSMLSVNVRATDDDGHSVTAAIEVTVTPLLR